MIGHRSSRGPVAVGGLSGVGAALLMPLVQALLRLGLASGRYDLARVEPDTFTEPWFGRTMLEATGIEVITARAGLMVERLWSAGDRWFAPIDTPGCWVSPH